MNFTRAKEWENINDVQENSFAAHGENTWASCRAHEKGHRMGEEEQKNRVHVDANSDRKQKFNATIQYILRCKRCTQKNSLSHAIIYSTILVA